MNMARANTKSFTAAIAGVVVLAAGVAGSVGVDAKSDTAARQRAARQGHALRPSVIDLGAQAKERRSGQVLAGDPPTRRAPGYLRDQGAQALREGTQPAIEMPEPAPRAPSSGSEPSSTMMVLVPSTALPGESANNSSTEQPPLTGGQQTFTSAVEQTRVQQETVQQPPVRISMVPTTPVPDTTRRGVIAVQSPKAGFGEDRSGSPRAVAASAVGITFARFEGNAANVRYRMLDDATGLRGGAWATPTTGDYASGRVEIETARDVEAVLVLGEDVKLVLAPMSRVRLENQLTAKGGTEMAVELTRGEVDIEPLTFDELGLARSPVRVRTPDKSYTTRVAMRVKFDASSGTTQQVVVPTE